MVPWSESGLIRISSSPASPRRDGSVTLRNLNLSKASLALLIYYKRRVRNSKIIVVEIKNMHPQAMRGYAHYKLQLKFRLESGIDKILLHAQRMKPFNDFMKTIPCRGYDGIKNFHEKFQE